MSKRSTAWRLGIGLTCLISVWSLLAACERRATGPETREESKVPEPEASAVPDVTRESPPRQAPELSLDPAVDDKGAPFAGLRVRSVGQPLGSSQHLVVLFHGYGAEGDDLVPLASRLNAKTPATYILPEAPFALRSRGRAWFARDRANFDEGLSYARAVVEFCAKRRADVKLVVGGFSQGAMLTANLLADAPPQMVGALVLSPADHLPFAPTEDMRHVPVFLSHGTRDQVLPFAGGVRLKERLTGLGYPVEFLKFNGRHQIPPDVVEGAARFVRSLYGAESSPPQSDPSPE